MDGANFEQQLSRGLFSQQRERTFVDKVLAREDVNAIRELIKKPRLTRSELLELLYLITGVESKLVNYEEYERYLQLKLFVWIREFIKTIEEIYDYYDVIKANEKNGIALDKDVYKMFDNAALKMEHNAKFLVDLYLNIARTSMSVGAGGFMELLKNKFEMSYPQMQPQQKTGGGFMSKLTGGGKNE